MLATAKVILFIVSNNQTKHIGGNWQVHEECTAVCKLGRIDIEQ